MSSELSLRRCKVCTLVHSEVAVITRQILALNCVEGTSCLSALLVGQHSCTTTL